MTKKGKKIVTEQVINITNDQAVMGAVIAQIRESYGMQKQELAEKMELSPSAWSRVEKGETTLTAFQLRRITEIFGVSSDRIFELAKDAEEGLRAKGVAVESSDNFNSKTGWRKGGGAGLDIATASSLAASEAGVVSAAAGVAALGSVIVPILGSLLGGLVGGIIYAALNEQDDE